MPLNLGPVPNFTAATPQVDAFGNLFKLAQLREMAGQAALQPGQLQMQQEQLTGAQLENEQKRLALQDQQGATKYWTNPEAYNPGDGETVPMQNQIASFIGTTPDDPLVTMTAGLMKAGVRAPAAFAEAKGIVESRKVAYQSTEEHQKVIENTLTDVNKILAPILTEKDPLKKSVMLAEAKPGLLDAAAFDPEIKTILQGASVENIDAIANRVGAEKDAWDVFTSKQAALKAAGETTKVGLEIAPVTADSLATFTGKTLPSFASLSPEQKGAYTAEAQQARTMTELQAVEARADATDKAEKMHADSLAQTKAIVGEKFNQKGTEEIGKFWTDPHTGYAGALAQAKQTISSIKAGADGNGLVTSMVPTMEVLGINHAAGISRISPAEAAAAALPGGWAERWNAWAAKAMTGKLSKELATEGQELMNTVTDAAYGRALSSSQYSAAAHHMAPSETTVMDRDGKWTTLDKVNAPSAQPKATHRYNPDTGKIEEIP